MECVAGPGIEPPVHVRNDRHCLVGGTGDSITWEGDWQGKPYRDHGTIVVTEERRRLVFTHFSPLSGKPDRPENYHTITFELDSDGTRTLVTLSQDNNRTKQDREYAENNWKMVLEKLKGILEG